MESPDLDLEGLVAQRPGRWGAGLGCVSKVLGAILTPTLHIGQAPNCSFLVSMYWQINGTGAHTPPRQTN